MSQLVAAARKYMNVRFRHRGRNERGLDCAGLASVAYRDCGVALKDFLLYAKEPQAHDAALTKHMAAALGEAVAQAPVRLSELQVGDVIVLRFEVEPHHVAIVTDYLFGGFGIIHADGHSKRVLEHRLTPDMVNRITHVFRRPV